MRGAASRQCTDIGCAHTNGIQGCNGSPARARSARAAQQACWQVATGLAAVWHASQRQHELQS